MEKTVHNCLLLYGSPLSVISHQIAICYHPLLQHFNAHIISPFKYSHKAVTVLFVNDVPDIPNIIICIWHRGGHVGYTGLKKNKINVNLHGHNDVPQEFP